MGWGWWGGDVIKNSGKALKTLEEKRHHFEFSSSVGEFPSKLF